MTSPTFTASSSDDVSLTPGQAKFLYWFVGTVPILKAMTPISTHLGNLWVGLGKEAIEIAKKTGNAEQIKRAIMARGGELYGQVISDVSRQTATCSLQLISYFVVGDIIKAGLKKYYSTKPAEKQDPGFQQVITQVVPLLAQVIATIMSRGLGSSQLNKLMQQNPDGTRRIIAPAAGKWRPWVNAKINQHFRNKVTDVLKPGKASLVATGGMIGYFGVLVGVLYGLSTLLEKVLPDEYKSKKGKPQPTPPKPAFEQPRQQLNTVSQLPISSPIQAPMALNPLPTFGGLKTSVPFTANQRPHLFS